MPPKGKKTKAEEALDFLSNLDNLDEPTPESTSSPNSSTAPKGTSASAVPGGVEVTPRGSSDSTRKSTSSNTNTNTNIKTDSKGEGEGDEEAQKALDFLQAQINQKSKSLSSNTNKPLSRSSTPSNPALAHAHVTSASAAGPVNAVQDPQQQQQPINVPSSTSPNTSPNSGGWGVSSFWSSATSALQQAQKVADEQYKKVRQEGVQGVTHQLENLGVKGVNVPNVDLNKLRKGAEERLGGIVKGVDLEKLRQDLVNTTTSTLTSILDTVAPPISAHETLELWLTHPMIGYSGVEGVIYRAWVRILEQTESGELIIVWSPPPTGEKGGPQENAGDADSEGEGRSINPVEGWDKAWENAKAEIQGVKKREEENPKGRNVAPNAQVPVTTVPIFLHLQPLLAPLPYPEPPIHNSTSTSSSDGSTPTKHLYFLLTLHDPAHSLSFTTVSQPSPADWMEVEYEKSEWVEERLVEILRTSVEVIAQDYVATRMGLKPSAPTAAAVTALVEQANQAQTQAQGQGQKEVSDASSTEKKSD
ncbi:uncharacterized protein I303_106756 [Kwoniella dejecticola CBS 10117]|uniref:Maintenance of telomere capping protein 1 n=1 Tax=Kwoniella dejecticola CBS 10117 TaxID=1296121 RepID=A0A1A5ZTS3_9TREE|nr:uncharacterized protein I303_08602 [Kwoniella dejecticola CBS 10117]OBR81217.1 hypothetical protein I303_08602 [Kwoniella dejecticola CBS 10117]